MQRLLPPSLVTLLIVLMVALSFAVSSPALPTVVRVLGLPVLLAGTILTVRHARLFDAVGTNIVTFNDPEKLVRTAAFAWTRNPMYLGFTLILTGIAMTLGSAVALVGPAIFFMAADRWYIPFEERRLLSAFGDQYVRYQSEVRRWIGVSR